MSRDKDLDPGDHAMLPPVYILMLLTMMGQTPTEVDPFDPDNSKNVPELAGPPDLNPGSPIPQPL